MAHYSYKDSFIEAIIGDIEPFCRTKSAVQGLDCAYMQEAQGVEENFPAVVKLFYTDPTAKIKTIVTFKNNIVSEEYLCDHNSMNSGLMQIINSILYKTKTYLQNPQEGEKEWGEALRFSYNGAVSEGVYPNPQMGSSLERDIATRLNLDSCGKNRSAVASLSVTQVKLGKQVAALSKAVIADKLDKLEEVLVIRNLDMMPATGTFNIKFNAVMEYFGEHGRFYIPGVKEFYALSTEKRIVYIRFWTKKMKYTAEKMFKDFKTLNPWFQLIAARPIADKFSSDIRQSRDEIRLQLLKLYIGSLNANDLGQYVPSFEAFKRGIFLDEKYFWDKGTLKMFVEFTDPTNTVAVLSYSFGSDPFLGFEWDQPTPNPRLRAKHPEAEYNLINRGIHVLNKHVK